MYKISLYLLITLFWINSFAQKTILLDTIYNKNIKTVELMPINSPFSYPIITLETNQQLILSFDDFNMENNASDYQYTFVHCNSDWSQSDLVFEDYIDGFQENYFYDYDNSFNTQTDYTHYSVKFPNDDLRFYLSGNYIINVYTDNNPENIVLTKKFYVAENNAFIDAKIHIPSLNLYKRNYQQVDFTVSSNEFSNVSPMNYVKVVVNQNNRPDRTLNNLQPRFIKGNQLIFDNPQENIFLGGNEFRFFDTKSTHFAPEKVAKIELKDVYHYYLIPEQEYQKYLFHKDINGRYYIGNDNGTNSSNDADYVKVHFYFPREYPLLEDVYIVGEFNNWKYLPEYKMSYNQEYKVYQATLFLKQGYYNYLFDTKKESLQEIDGNYSETNNTYLIFVYFRDMAMDYDKLLGVKVIGN